MLVDVSLDLESDGVVYFGADYMGSPFLGLPRYTSYAVVLPVVPWCIGEGGVWFPIHRCVASDMGSPRVWRGLKRPVVPPRASKSVVKVVDFSDGSVFIDAVVASPGSAVAIFDFHLFIVVGSPA